MNNNIVLCKIKRKPLHKKSSSSSSSSSCVLGASTTIAAPTTFIQPVSVHAPTQQQLAASNFYGCPPEATFQFGAPNLPFDFSNCGVPYNQFTQGGGGGGGGGGVQQQQQQQQSVYVTTSTSTVVGDYVDTIGGGGGAAGEIIGRMDWDKDFGHNDDTTVAATQLKSTNVEDDNLVEDDSWTEFINMIDDSLAQHQTAPQQQQQQQPQPQPQPSVEGSLDDDDDHDELIAQINNTSKHKLAY